MRSTLHISDLSLMIRRINKLGRSFGFTVYIMITEKYIQVYRNDGLLMIQHHAHDEINIQKVYDALCRLYSELEQALLGATKFYGRYKMKYFIYFNY